MAFKVGKCRLRYHLARKRISQQELADLVGVTKQTISRYVNNAQIMSYETAFNIANVLDCEMEELYEFRKSTLKG